MYDWMVTTGMSDDDRSENWREFEGRVSVPAQRMPVPPDKKMILQGKLIETDGDDRKVGERAGILISGDGFTVYDTQGIATYRVENEREDAAVTLAHAMWQSFHCTDCGERVSGGAIYCRVCRPYGFWHWLAYFSPIAWRRVWGK